MNQRVAVGIDLGGTNLKLGLVSASGTAASTGPASAPTASGPDDVLEQLVTRVEMLLADARVDRASVVGVGLGSPGPLSHVNGIIYRLANLPGWDHVPIRDELQKRLNLPVTLENDGNAAAFGEHWVGAGRDGADMVMLTLGTGVGGGVILGGALHRGARENAGEIGHMIVEAGGLACTCGQRGCLERYASASAVARRAEDAIRGGAASMLAAPLTRGETLDAERVARAARDGDALCRRVWEEACAYLAIACVNIEHLFNPARIVLGGGMARAGAPLFDAVRGAFLQRRWHLHAAPPRITPAALGYDAGWIGAAGCAWRAFGTRR